MESLVQLLIEWEIQLLVVLSFTLQAFLLFTGSIRRRRTNTLLRSSMWIAYLGADLVAVYALGFLSQQDDPNTACNTRTLRGTHQLAFLWAPFLLIHLGGQDTVTAFAMEDNNLWLRQLLNLVLQGALAMYVFWKSIGRDNIQLLVLGIFMFVAGILKYGERTLALMYGDLKNNKSSFSEEDDEEQGPQVNRDDGYSGVVCFALRTAPIIRDLFAGRTTFQMKSKHVSLIHTADKLYDRQLPKMLEIELAMVYDDLYTKAMVLRTRTGIILRCVSQLSAVVALALFLVSNKEPYSRVDVAITYTLFVGGIFLEGSAMLMTVMVSPWTWAWLKARKCSRLAHVSWLLFSSDIGWSEKKPLWSNSMGQYSLLTYIGCEQSRLSERVMTMVRKMASIVGIKKDKFLWVSMLLDTEHVKVNEKIMDGIIQVVHRLHKLVQARNFPEILTEPSTAEQWPNLGPLLKQVIEMGVDLPLGHLILALHIFTVVHLSKYPLPPPPPPPLDIKADITADATACSPPLDMHANAAAEAANAVVVDVCRKLSNYMLYLLVTNPSMLQLVGSTEDTLEFFLKDGYLSGSGSKDDILRRASERFGEQMGFPEPQPCNETLQEIQDMSTGLLLYTAGKSRPELHAAHLARGGELFTFAWLLMSHKTLGDSGSHRIQLGDVFSTRETMYMS